MRVSKRGSGKHWTTAIVMTCVGGYVAASVGSLPTPSAGAETRGGIAYAAGSDLGVSRILIAGREGARPRPLVRPSRAGTPSHPAWSPDGARLAFTRAREEGERKLAELWVMDADGTSAKRLTAGQYDSGPAWSPDGQRIAFTRLLPPNGRDVPPVSSLMVVDADGNGERALTSAATFDRDPAWSPDGRRIAFSRTTWRPRSLQGRVAVVALPVDGGAESILARDGGQPDFSPDGSRIAFVSVRDRNGRTCFESCSPNGEIYTMAADGGELRRLTHDPADDLQPEWSPDGSRIAFVSPRDYPRGGNPELYVMRADGFCPTRLTFGSARASSPDWGPGPATGAALRGPCRARNIGGVSDADLRPALRVNEPPVFFPGRRLGGLLLTSVSAEPGSGVQFRYEDCALAPRRCPWSFQLEVLSTCRRHPLFDGRNARTAWAFEVRGTLAVDLSGEIEVYAGRSVITFHSTDMRMVRRAFVALRPLRGRGSSGRPLPPPELPGSALRELRRTVAVHARTGSIERTHRRIGTSRSAVKYRLRLARVLEGLGSPRTRRGRDC